MKRSVLESVSPNPPTHRTVRVLRVLVQHAPILRRNALICRPRTEDPRGAPPPPPLKYTIRSRIGATFSKSPFSSPLPEVPLKSTCVCLSCRFEAFSALVSVDRAVGW